MPILLKNISRRIAIFIILSVAFAAFSALHMNWNKLHFNPPNPNNVLAAGLGRGKLKRISPSPTASPTPTPTVSPTSTPAPTPAPSPSPSTAPVSYSLKFGVVVDDYSNQSGGLSAVQTMLNKPVSTISIFKQFGSATNNSITQSELSYAKSQGMKVLLAWEPWNPSQGMNQSTDYLAAINNGSEDGYIKSFADSLKTYGAPVDLRFGHEMNGNWYPWGNRPADYIAAYRHVVSIFRSEGASNVRFMWCINADNIPSSPISTVSQFYPGEDVVDVVGIDGYNFGGSNWKDFKDVFSSPYNFLTTTYSKPIEIAETASSEVGGNKAQWVQSMFQTELPTLFPNVHELVWFDLNKEADWRINSSDASLQSFITYLPA